MVEAVISVALFGLVLMAILTFLFWTRYYNATTKADRESSENARKILNVINYEIKGAKSLYTSTTTASQLSLETLRYLPTDETDTFIDFFLCGTNVCLKKESQNPVILNSDLVQVTNLAFTRIMNGTQPSLKINLTVTYNGSQNSPPTSSTTTLTSTVALRTY